MEYVNSWPGVNGKLSKEVLNNVKHSSHTSFIKSSQDLQHSLLYKYGKSH